MSSTEYSVRVEVVEDYGAMSRAAARVVAARLRENPEAVMLLPTGSTPLGMYGELVKMHREEGLSFASATFFNLDEYLGLPAGHPASYHEYMWRNFFGLVDVDPEGVHVPDGTAGDPEDECERYEARIREAGGVDLCVLGIGRNGHVGFNEPGSSFASRTRIVELSRSTRRANAGDFSEGAVPEQAITVGMRTIFGSREIVLLASGKNKAGAVAEALNGPVTEEVPASMLQEHPRALFLLDREAASSLRRRVA